MMHLQSNWQVETNQVYGLHESSSESDQEPSILSLLDAAKLERAEAIRLAKEVGRRNRESSADR